ncbi:MAG: hypothetical protein WC343_07640 [Bacilli bacterium]|jgi:spore coat protein YutH
MINYINYYYNIYPDSIHEQNKNYYFDYNSEKYYFIVFNRPLEDTNYLYELNIEMIRRGSLVHELIENKDKTIITFVNDIPYVLMKIFINENKKSDLAEIAFISMNNAYIKQNKILDRSDWVTLWSAKVDYFEYQISQVGKKYPLICEYFSYFLGLAENAIGYAKNTVDDLKSEYIPLTIAHKRIKEDDTLFEIYNPLSFIIDCQVRDIAEYIKAQLFNGNNPWPEIEQYFISNDISIYNRRMLYARLLFPSSFFDVYEDIIDGKLIEKDIFKIIYKVDEYESFLNEFYTYINRGHLMPKIDWLNKD